MRHAIPMKRLCPTILELLAFDAVARHGSVTLAAEALCVSVSGISKQLSGLERFIGKPMFRKNGRGIVLTPAGREYWMKISPCLRTLESASFEARAEHPGGGILTLASVPTFLTKWLIPRLAGFRRDHPDVTFSFRQHVGAYEGFPSDIDAAIRYGEGHWQDVRSDYIAGCEFVCIAAPDLVPDTGVGGGSAVVLQHTFLHHEQAPQAWPGWAAQHGIKGAQVVGGPRFAQYSALIQASLSGLGLGLVPQILVEDELQEGRLTAVGDPVTIDQGHYFCYVEDKLERPLFAAFRDWLLREGRGAARKPGAGPFASAA